MVVGTKYPKKTAIDQAKPGAKTIKAVIGWNRGK